MKSVGIALGVVGVLLGGFLLFVASKPNSFSIERSMEIQAPPEDVFALINDFHMWSQWSPWEKLDPAMKKTFSGSEKGAGSEYAWAGNKKVGEGKMEIIEAQAPSKVTMKIDFLKPFEAHNVTEFTIVSSDGQTSTVTWKMSGPNPFMMKAVGVFMNMDKVVGKDFETGLTNLKALAEKAKVLEEDRD